MKKSVLARIGFFTQEDKVEIEEQLGELEDGIKGSAASLEEKINELSVQVKEVETRITNISNTVSRIENAIMSMEQIINDAGDNTANKLGTSLKNVSEYIELLKKDIKNNSQLLNKINSETATKDDLEVVSSFLRFIAANQLLSEAEDAITREHDEEHNS